MSTASERHPRIGTGNLRAAPQLLPAFVFVIAPLLLGSAIALASAHTHGLTYLFGGLAAGAILVVLFYIPVRALPVVALLVTLLVPTETTLLPHLLQGTAPGVVPLGVWMIRARSTAKAPAALRGLALALAFWLVLSEIFAPFHSRHGWEWLITASVAMIIVVLSTPSGLKPQSFRSVFLGLTTALGAYALLEGFLLHHNFLFGILFEHDSWWVTQQHSASYRVTTLLGHPLVNGTIFSAAAVLAASDMVYKSARSRIALLRLGILIGATIATHSRGAAIALAIGLIVVIAFSRGRGEGQQTRRLVLIVSFIVGGAFLIYGLQARNESQQGQSSAEVRVTVIKRAAETLRLVEPFGAGPGESDGYRAAKQLPGWEIDLENSYAELAVSIGLVGLFLVVALLIGIVVFGLQHDAVVGEAAALLTILVDIAGFNAIEGHKPLLILIALLAILILAAPRRSAKLSSPPEHRGVKYEKREPVAQGS